jgi:xylulokinase
MTGPSIVVTLDIGGSAAKASAYDAVRDVTLASAADPYPEPPAPGMFDPDAWWQAALTALRTVRELTTGQGDYLGITVSAIRIPFVLLNASGEAAMPGLLNKDRRAAGHIPELKDALYRTTGHWPAAEFGLPKLLWARANHPAAWRATRHVLQLHDWFIYRLSGVLASEPSSAAMSQMLDVDGTWATGLLAGLGIPEDLLPALRQAGETAGGLTKDAAQATGFRPGTPVHIGGGDTHMSALSAGATPGIPVVVAGTTAPAVLTTASPPRRGALFPLLISKHVTKGEWALETNAGPTGGIAMLLVGLAREKGSSLRNELRDRGMTLADGDDELTVLAGNPFFGPDGWAATPQPTVIGLRDSHTGADVLRACQRGTCYAIAAILRCLLGSCATRPPYLLLTGGMSRDAQWAQQLADVTGTPVRVPADGQVAGRAGAMIVTGQSRAFHPAERAVDFTPRADRAAAHAEGSARYQELYRGRMVTSARAH